MGNNESNAGFVGLHNPAGFTLVVMSLLLVMALIIGGGVVFKYAQIKDREQRSRLRKDSDKNEPTP